MEPDTKETQPSDSSTTCNRVFGFLLLVLLFGLGFAHGYGGNMNVPSNNAIAALQAGQLAFAAIFTVLGFGLVFSYYRFATWTGIWLVGVVVSLTMLLSPLFQSFWLKVFVGSFQNTSLVNGTTQTAFFFSSFNTATVYLNFTTLQLALQNAIAQLIVFACVLNRLSPAQIIASSILFTVTYNLDAMLNFSIQRNSQEQNVFDDYQINSVYGFSTFYALFLLIVGTRYPKSIQCSHNNKSGVLALMGAGFLFLGFSATYVPFAGKALVASAGLRTVIFPEAYALTLLAQCAGVFTTMCICALIDGKFALKDIIGTVIIGGVTYGPIAGLNTNWGAPIAIGMLVGLLYPFYLRFVMKRINANSVFDSTGFLGILVLTFIGNFIIAPTYLYVNSYRQLLSTVTLTNSNAAAFVLIYIAISYGIGLISGGFNALLLFCLPHAKAAYDDRVMFMADDRLKPLEGEAYQAPDQPQSAAVMMNSNV